MTAASASASAGDAPIAVHAEVSNGTGTPSWELQGPGTLSATIGIDIQYTPPDAENLDDAATALITARLGTSLSRQVQIALAPVALPGRHWSVVRPGRWAWRKVAYGDGTFVALSPLGGIVSHSADGVTWTEVPLAPFAAFGFEDLAHGAAGWVAVKSDGHTATSADGKSWTLHENALRLGSLESVCVIYGNGVYLAYNRSSTRVSSDGIHWTGSDTHGFIKIAAGNGLFIGIGGVATNGPMRVAPYVGADGLRWTPATDPGDIRSIAFRHSDFAANGSEMLRTTSTGQTWIGTTDRSLKGGILDHAGGVLFEYNGDTLGVALNGQTVVQLAVIDTLSAPVSVAFGAGRYLGVSNLGWVSSSADALQWSTVLAGSVGNLTAVEFFNGSYVALSDLGWALRSADGVAWIPSELVPHLHAQSPAFSPLAMAHGGGTLVAVGSAVLFATTGMWMRSTDGMAWWPAQTAGPAAPVTAVVHDGNRFVAVDRSGTVHQSPDGDRWSVLGSVPGGPALTGIAYGNGTYVVVGRPGTLASSADGSNWALAPPLSSPSNPGGATMSAVTWAGNRFVAVGPDGMSAISTDGRNWTAASTALPATTVAAANGVIVAATAGVVMSSIDGLRWRTRVWADGRAGVSALTYAQGRFVGVGLNSAISVSDH